MSTPDQPFSGDPQPDEQPANPPQPPPSQPFPPQVGPYQPSGPYPPAYPPQAYPPGYPPPVDPSQPPQPWQYPPPQPWSPTAPPQPGQYSPQYVPQLGDVPSGAMPPQPYPPYPPQPWPQGEYPGSAPWQGMAPPAVPPTPSEPWYRAFAEPLPLWSVIMLLVVGIGILVALFLSGTDWAAGAANDGIAAAIGAGLVAIATGTRSLAGMAAKTNKYRSRQYVGAGVTAALLLAIFGASIGLQATIHKVQAGVFEHSSQFTQALNEYRLADEHAPGASDLARIYDEWGEHFAATGNFTTAISTFTIVLTSFTQGTAEFTRAQNDTISAYTSLGKQASAKQDYLGATNTFNTVLNLTYCQATCQQQTQALDATAYFSLAEQELSQSDFTDAVTNFALIGQRFPNSPEASEIHGEYAKALLGEGQQQISSSSCSSALPTYQQLVSQFSDTPQGQTAKQALKAPQPVQGSFQSYISPGGFVALVKNLQVSDFTNNTIIDKINHGVVAPVNSNGSFKTKAIPQGTYDLVWGVLYSNNTATIVGDFNQQNHPFYVAAVGPLCPFDFGQIADPYFIQPGASQTLGGTHLVLNVPVGSLSVLAAEFSAISIRGKRSGY